MFHPFKLQYSFSEPFSIVAELPEQKPTITGIHSRYRQGDTLQGNCTSHYSKPAANLTWTINDVPVRFITFVLGVVNGFQFE